ncbi:hypothetical protein FF011L_38880 [Roseimaritima multifibrata]|uniref:Uncharacterized protein n=1 Tax=Roseimaritima multifibrata TaxID=1930274 RepID=A0A517MJR8_9BACT|nr:hypothetical protein FF011L_38880 [Roseimaritima multifibrata]
MRDYVRTDLARGSAFGKLTTTVWGHGRDFAISPFQNANEPTNQRTSRSTRSPRVSLGQWLYKRGDRVTANFRWMKNSSESLSSSLLSRISHLSRLSFFLGMRIRVQSFFNREKDEIGEKDGIMYGQNWHVVVRSGNSL